MYDFNQIITEGAKTVDPYIKAYGVFSSAMILGFKLIGKFKSLVGFKYYDIDEIFRDVKEDSLRIGSIIETCGFLFDYGQVFKPYTHVNGMFGKCKQGEANKVFKNGRLFTEASMVMGYKVFQPPVQKIPHYQGIGCAFLYDTRFESFNYEQNPIEAEREIKPIIINDYSKPIMVLYDVKKFRKYINKEVKIKARVIELPQNLALQLNGIFDDNIRQICSNFIDAYSESNNFICLVVLEEQTEIIEMSNIEKIDELMLPIYVEAELEALNRYCPQDLVRTQLENIIPNLPQKLDPHFPVTVANTTSDIGIPFISIDDINIMFREPNVIGFYTDIKAFNKDEYPIKLMEFSNLVTNFAVDYKNMMKKTYRVKDSMKLNFLFDYEKQYVFDPRGVLYSNTARKLVELDDKEKYIQEWLRG